MHALSVGLISVPVILEDTRKYPDDRCNGQCDGTRVTPPTDCAVRSECSFHLQMYDADDKPALTGSLVSDLALGLNCSCDARDCGQQTNSFLNPPHQVEADTLSSCKLSVAMVDNRDGTFTATVPADWVRAKGSRSLRFFRGEAEFRPSGFDDYPGYDTLRTAGFGPRDCPAASHTIPDAATGAECVCEAGFVRDSGEGGGCHRSCDAATMQA